MDPYVVIEVGSNKFRSKTHNSGGKIPSWYDAFNMRRIDEKLMTIHVNDEDVFVDDHVGTGTIDLTKICEGPCKIFSDDVIIYYKGDPSGKIFMSIHFFPDVPPTYPPQYPPYYQHSYPPAYPQHTIPAQPILLQSIPDQPIPPQPIPPQPIPPQPIPPQENSSVGYPSIGHPS